MADSQSSSPEIPTISATPANAHPVSDATGLPRHVAAGLASIFILIGGVVFLILERKDRFVRFYAVQSILLGAVALMVSVAVEVVRFIFTHIPLVGSLLNSGLGLLNVVFSLAWFVVYVVVIVKAFSGKEWEIPYLGHIARRQAGGRIG